MRVISLTRCKALLGLLDTTYDAALNLAIPIVDSAVKQITNNRWNYRVAATTTEDSATVKIVSVVSPKYFTSKGYVSAYDDIDEFIEVGQLISGTGIADDSYITEVYYNSPDGIITDDSYILEVTISAVATATGEDVAAYLGIPIAYQNIIAKGCWWATQQVNTTIEDNSWTSKSMGPISVSKGTASEKIDNKSGMPLWFVQAFPTFMSGH